MSRQTLLMMAAVTFVTACSCVEPVSQAPAPATQGVSAPEPATMVKEAEQVIAMAEKESVSATAAVGTAEATAAVPGVTRCWLKSDLRTIAIEHGKDGSCQVVYESAGQNHVVANKSMDLADCTRLQERLKKNLIASGFLCE